MILYITKADQLSTDQSSTFIKNLVFILDLTFY